MINSQDWIFQQYVKELASKKRRLLSTKQKNMLQIKVKKLHKNAVIPTYANAGDAGMDLTATESESTANYIAYKTGLAFEIPEGYVGLLFPRSSNSKKQLLLTNSVGVLDSGYRGEVEFRFKIVGNGAMPADFPDAYHLGDKVGQLVVIPYPAINFTEVDELSSSERGEGGFGSSGN